jgi:hypothetical protein
MQRDAETMEKIIDELSDARYDQVSLQEQGINSLNYYRALLALAEAGGDIPSDVLEMGVDELSSYRGPSSPGDIASGLLTMGFPRAQIRLSREILRQGRASTSMTRAQHLVLAHALAGRGEWSEALSEADAFRASATHPEDLLFPYQIAVVGVWSGALGLEDALARRPDGDRESFAGTDLTEELGWLDGLLELVAGSERWSNPNPPVRGSDESPFGALLHRSLAAFRLAREGDTATAARELADIEIDLAEQGSPAGLGRAHPFLHGVHRLMSARWLLSAGDTLTARRLLPWYEGVLPGDSYRLSLANQLLAPHAKAIRSALAGASSRSGTR